MTAPALGTTVDIIIRAAAVDEYLADGGISIRVGGDIYLWLDPAHPDITVTPHNPGVGHPADDRLLADLEDQLAASRAAHNRTIAQLAQTAEDLACEWDYTRTLRRRIANLETELDRIYGQGAP